MPGQYTTTTLDQAVADVGNRLGDPNGVRWTTAEVAIYVQDALRVWGALTNAFRDSLTFNTAAFQTNAPFYDLGTVAPGLRGMTLTLNDLLHRIEYTLLEALNVGLAWAGTPQFTLGDLVQAIDRRRAQFLMGTGAVVTRSTMAIAPPPDGRVPLDQSIISLRRVAWTTVDGSTRALQRDDEWSANAYSRTWPQNPGRPRVVSVAVTEPLYMQLIPPPDDTGIIDLCAVVHGPALTATTALLGVPDDWAWVLYYGALADLLGRDGLAFDPLRAAYCEARFQHGLRLAAQAAVVLTARLDNVPCRIASIPDADSFRAGWQTPSQTPTMVLTLGQTLLATTPAADLHAPSGYAVTLDVVRNAPVPLNGTAFLPVGPEVLDAIYDYAQHLALCKEGPTELQAAQPLLDRFFKAAGAYRSWQAALQPMRKALLGQQSQDRRGTAANTRPTQDVQDGPAPGVTV